MSKSPAEQPTLSTSGASAGEQAPQASLASSDSASAPLPPARVAEVGSGTVLVPGYEILGELGHGGMGVVYKARHQKLDRLVALKMIRAGAGADEQELARFRTEARAVAKLQHPHIVQIYEVGEHQGLPFFALEFCSGGSLAAKLKSDPLPAREAARLVEQIARAMQEAHANGIVHRDLKPANVLLTKDGSPRVADFGLAKKRDEEGQTATEMVMGTPSYMAPEQASGQSSQAGPLADVYALGAILYECLTGRPPFKAASTWETVKQVLTVDPVPPRQLNVAVPRELETICLKCLEKSPSRRYPSAAALAEDLRRWQAGEPIAARPVGRVERAVKWARRRPTAAALLGVSVLALLIVLVGGSFFTAWLAHEKSKAQAAEGATGQALTLAEEHLRDSRIQSARLTLERALLLCEQGEINRGLLWMARGLEMARRAQAEDLEQAFRWNLGAWSREVHRLERILPHPDSVEAVALNREGTLLATGCADGKVRLWDMATGVVQGESLDHPGPVHALAFQPQGELLLTGCDDGRARLWHVPTRRVMGQPLVHYLVTEPATTWPWKTGILSVAFSPDGRSLVTAGRDGTVRLWDTTTGKAVAAPLTPGGGMVFAVAFRPDGQAFLTAGRIWTVQQWNPATGKAIGPRMVQALAYAAAYSPNGKAIVAGYLQTRAARQWDAQTGQAREPLLHHRAPVMTVCYSPDGRLVLTGSMDQTARLWDSATGQPLGSPLEHSDTVLATAFSPDGKTVITGSSDRLVRLWKLAPGSLRSNLPHPNWVQSVAFSPDATQLVTGADDGALRLWDTAHGKLAGPLLRQGGAILGVAFCPDGKTAFGLRTRIDPQLVRWDLRTGQRLGEGTGPADQPLRLAYHPGSSTLVTSGRFQSGARIWDATTLRPRGDLLRHGKGAVLGVAISPDGRLVLTGGEDKTTRLWDLATGQPLGPPIQHPSGISAVAFNFDGQRILTGSQDRTVQLWEASTWKPLGTPLQHQGELHGVAFVGRGPLLVSCGNDNTARIWFAPTSHAVGPPLVHQDRVNAIAVSADGTTLATASTDTTAKLWTVPLPVTEEPDQVAGWVQTLTGRELDEHGTIRVLPSADWQSRRERFPFSSQEDGP